MSSKFEITQVRFNEIVQAALEKYGLDADFEEQCKHWQDCFLQDNPGTVIVEEASDEDEWYEVKVPATADVVDQPVWLSAVCDEVVYGKGAESVVVFPHGALETGFVVEGSQQEGVTGYGLMVDDDNEVCGLFPLLEGSDDVFDSYHQALRVRANGGRYLYLHEGLSLDKFALDGFKLRSFSVSSFGWIKSAGIREANSVDYALRETVLTVQYPYGYCYLNAVAVKDQARAALKFGYGPPPQDFAHALGLKEFEPSTYLQGGEISMGEDDGVVHLSRGHAESAVSGVSGLLDALAGTQAGCLAGADLVDNLLNSERSSRSFSPPSVVSGMTGAEVYDVRKRAGSTLSPEVRRGKCDDCGFVVVLDGHATRCRPERIRASNENRDALVGDAMHAADVKQLVAACTSEEKQMTILANKYIASHAQREYLETFHPGVCQARHSDHTWGTIFEVMYHGDFRRNYLGWLARDMGVMRLVAESVLAKVESSLEPALGVVGLASAKTETSEITRSDDSVVDKRLYISCVSWRRVLAKIETAMPVLVACERKAIEELSRAPRSDSVDGGYKRKAKSSDYVAYRRQCVSLLETMVQGSGTKFSKVMGFRGAYLIKVLSSILAWSGVAVAKLEAGSVMGEYVKFVVGEYIVEVPIPQSLFFDFRTVKPKDCNMCGNAHWVSGNSSMDMDCCVLDKLGQEFSQHYESILASLLQELK